MPPVTLEVVLGDITRLNGDAIVNAANSSLAGGGGVDGAIHRAAGPQLVRASRALAPCPPGEVRVTEGFDLPARWVIHAVGPVWRGGAQGEAETLASAYRNALRAGARHGARSIAFPAISTGIYGYPLREAAEIAVATVREETPQLSVIERVVFCVFSAEAEDAYRTLLASPLRDPSA